MIAGTSTGGIIALALAHGITAAEALAVYRDRGARIFPPRTGVSKWRQTLRWVSKPMYGCPRSRKVFYEWLGRVIGCGHVSGLRCGGYMPRAGMEMRGPGADQTGELLSSKGFIACPGPDPT